MSKHPSARRRSPRTSWDPTHSRPPAGAAAGTRLRAASVLPLLRLPLRHRDRLPVQDRMITDPADDRVLHEVLVVALGIVVRPRVRAAALLALEARDEHASREIEQVPELDRLRQ